MIINTRNEDRDREGDSPRGQAPDGALCDVSGGASGGTSEPAREARLAQRISDEIKTLDELKRTVLNHLYGLGGEKQSSHEAVAALLEMTITDALRAELAAQQGVAREQFRVDVDFVQGLESQALRNLRGHR